MKKWHHYKVIEMMWGEQKDIQTYLAKIEKSLKMGSTYNIWQYLHISLYK